MQPQLPEAEVRVQVCGDGGACSSRGGPGPGEGAVSTVPLVQQWTMATPVNTLCSFPFNL